MVNTFQNQPLNPLYVIAMGGTGAKCAEAIVHMASTGLFGNCKITFLFVDQDSGNGNQTNVRKAIYAYKDCKSVLKGEAVNWLRADLENLGVYSPLSGTGHRTLGDFFNYTTISDTDPLKGLFDVLYTPEERSAPLDDVGFRGRPAIGAAILSEIAGQDNLPLHNQPYPQGQYPQQIQNQKPPLWESLFNKIRANMGNGEPRIFLCGSIFGGTGASGFPTIARLIANEFTNARNNIKIGGCLMLPYFNFPSPNTQNEEKVFANSDEFLLKTEAALHYYKTQAKDQFDAIYLLGERELSSVAQNFSTGGSDQENMPHFLEFYAALLARSFLEHDFTPQQSSNNEKVVLMARDDIQGLTWDDLPRDYKDQIKSCLIQTTRFAYAWKADLDKELQNGYNNVKSFQKNAPWFRRFFQPEQGFLANTFYGKYEDYPKYDDEQREIVKKINAWCDLYLKWMANFHYSYSQTDSIKLFQASQIANNNKDTTLKLQQENFSTLITDNLPDQERNTSAINTIPYLKTQLEHNKNLTTDKGVIGLAKATYKLCKK